MSVCVRVLIVKCVCVCVYVCCACVDPCLADRCRLQGQRESLPSRPPHYFVQTRRPLPPVPPHQECAFHDSTLCLFRDSLPPAVLNGQIAARKSGLQMMFTRPRAALLEDLVTTHKQKQVRAIASLHTHTHTPHQSARTGYASAPRSHLPQQPRSVAMELLRSLSPTRVRLGDERDNKDSNQRGRDRERPESPPPQASPVRSVLNVV